MKKVLAVLAVVLTWPAAAHNLWIEPAEEGGLRARYGEPEIRMLERSPGKLDTLVPLRAEAPARRPAALDWRKAADAYLLHDTDALTDALVEARGSAGRSRYYARHAAWPLKAAQPAMALDIVPTGQADTFAVFFQGAPLTRGTLKVIAPSLWLQVHDIDGHGRVRIHTPWRGLYVLDVDVRDQPAGEAAGPRPDAVTHRMTLSFTKPEGVVFDRPLPAQFTDH